MKFKELYESVWSVEVTKMLKKYLKYGSNTTSIPSPVEDEAIILRQPSSGDTGKIYRIWDKKKLEEVLRIVTNKYDKAFHDIEELVAWLNKEHWVYVGIDDRNEIQRTI